MVDELIDPIYESKQPKMSGQKANVKNDMKYFWKFRHLTNRIVVEINRTRTISFFYFYFIEARERGKSV